MSLWPDDIRVGLAAERVLWLRMTGWLQRRVIEKQLVSFPVPSTGRLWSNAVAALDTQLKASKNKRSILRIVLSNRFVRYVALPWHDAVISRAERLAQARHHFKQIYGDMADGWSIECSAPHYERPALATAVDSELLAELRRVALSNGCRIRAVQPYLTAAYGRLSRRRRSKRGTPSALCVVEPGQIACLMLHDSAPRTVFNQRTRDNWQGDLQALLQQVDAHGALHTNVEVFAPDSTASAGNADAAGFKRLLAHLPVGLSAASDTCFSMALMAAE